MTTGSAHPHARRTRRLRAGAFALAMLWLGGCGRTEPESSEVVEPASATPAEIVSADRVAALWGRSCALCHVDGTGGAPRLGDAAAWQPRISQGLDVLLQHTLEGYNNMPPLGYCQSCEREDFAALIHFMTGAN